MVEDVDFADDTRLARRAYTAGVVASFIAWATDRPKDHTLAAQNVSFDLEFVQAAARRAGIESPFGKRTLDVHTLVWMHMRQQGIEPSVRNRHSAISLDYALEYAGVPKEPAPHNALMGALCHAEVISRVVYNKKAFPEFNAYDIPWRSSNP